MTFQNFALRLVRLFVVAVSFAAIWPAYALAQSGMWTEPTGDGPWSTSGNWSGGTIADGAGNTATFSTDLDAVAVNAAYPGFFRNAVYLDAPRTIGHLVFGDSNPATGGAWEMYTDTTPAHALTLSAASPTITVNQLTPFDTGTGIIDDAVIRAPVISANGFTKLGPGILTLDAANNAITGTVAVNAGTLRLSNVATFTAPAPSFSLANGATLSTGTAISNVSVAANSTTTLNVTGGSMNLSSLSAPTGAGSSESLDVNVALGNVTVTMGGAWAGFDTLNLTGQTVGSLSILRMVPNNSYTGAPPATDTASFANTRLKLDNMQIRTRTNSNGNTIVIGELSGTATGELAGGGAGPGTSGSAARYEIGGLNTDSTFSGVINGVGGVSLNKVGTGKLTLAGTFSGTPALTGQNAARQGGVFRVTNGTLALTGESAIPGGTGTVLTTIDVLANGVFDVTGTPSTFSTSALQKLQGSGTVRGTYNHDEGFIRPGDVGAATAGNEGNLSSGVVATAGTLNFDGALQLNGGTIIYDMSLNPASGNDLISVTGTTTLGSGRVVPNFLNGIPTTGTYTVVQSSNGFSGSESNILVDMPGRTPDKPMVINGNLLQFDASGTLPGKNLTWTGANSGAWDLETTVNWTDGSMPEKYFNLDSVAFTEAGANKTITLNAVAQPMTGSTITIDNTSAYSFSGTGAISGNVGLTKTGTGSLSMQLNNTFNGPVSISDSSVNVAGFTGTGSGPMTLNNATYIATVSVSNSSLDIPAGTTSTVQLDGNSAAGGASNIPTLTGGGTLNLTSTVNDKFFGTFNTSGFTGTLNVAPSGAANDLGDIRIRGGQTDFTNAVVNLTATGISNQQGAAAGSIVTVGFGEVHADVLSNFTAFGGGSTPPDIIWEIGAKNTDSNIDGIIADGTGGGNPSISNVRKVGSGTLTLGGANSYSGFTRVDDGILSLAQPNIADSPGDFYVYGDSILNLTFSTTDQIDSLYLDNVPQAVGTYGRVGHPTATFKVPYITGDGVLEVLALGPSLGLIGDYNNDGTVDAADYTVYRNNVGNPGSSLMNRSPFVGSGVVGGGDYDAWKENFGATSLGSGSLASVPEPACWLVAMLALVAGGFVRRR